MNWFQLIALVLVATTAIIAQVTCPGNGKATTNAKCCVWFDVLADIQQNLYQGGTCNNAARQSIMLAFHDAIGFSPSLTAQGLFGGGGADGSLMAFESETALRKSHFPVGTPTTDTLHVLFTAENLGTGPGVAAQKPFAVTHAVGFGDFIQFAAAVAGSNCPGHPRLTFLTGRTNATQPAPAGLVPEPSDSVDKILARMADAGFSPQETVALLFAHSIAAQHFIQPADPGTPFDSTPSLMDTQFYIEVKPLVWFLAGVLHLEAPVAIPGEFRLQSDNALARDPRTACTWQSYTNNLTLVQADYTAAQEKLAVLGQNTGKLTDCSSVIPPTRVATIPPPIIPAVQPPLNVIQHSCATTPFPNIPTQTGPPLTVSPVPSLTGAISTSQCTTGQVLCCSLVEEPNTASLQPLLGLLGVVVGTITGLVGTSCTPVAAVGVGAAGCSTQVACCTNNSFQGIVALGCTPVDPTLKR